MVGEEHGLGPLKMGVAGDHRLGMPSPQLDQGTLEVAHLAFEQDDLVPEPQPDVEGDLVVARAGGVELRGGRHAAGQLRLDVHVDVLQLRLPLEGSRLDFGAQGVQTGDDLLPFLAGEHPDRLQHRGVGGRAEEVVAPEPPVEGDRFGKGGDVGRGAAGKAAGAGDDGRFRGLRFLHAKGGRSFAMGGAKSRGNGNTLVPAPDTRAS